MTGQAPGEIDGAVICGLVMGSFRLNVGLSTAVQSLDPSQILFEYVDGYTGGADVFLADAIDNPQTVADEYKVEVLRAGAGAALVVHRAEREVAQRVSGEAREIPSMGRMRGEHARWQ
jgi:hypothetical protein